MATIETKIEQLESRAEFIQRQRDANLAKAKQDDDELRQVQEAISEMRIDIETIEKYS